MIMASARPVRRIPMKDTAYPAPRIHPCHVYIKSHMAYHPWQYAVSIFKKQPKGKICNTPYEDSLYAVLMIWMNIMEGLKISNVVPTASQLPIRRIDLTDTAYRPHNKQLYKLITRTTRRRAEPQFRNPNSKMSIFEALEEQIRYSNALNLMGNDL